MLMNMKSNNLIFTMVAACAAAIMMASCDHPNSNPPTPPTDDSIVAPHWQTNMPKVESCDWVRAVRDNEPSSMTIVVGAPAFERGYEVYGRDMVAVLTLKNQEFIGVTAVDRFEHLSPVYVQGPTIADDLDFSILYYSFGYKQYYCADLRSEQHTFFNDAILGTFEEPMQYKWTPCGPYMHVGYASVYFFDFISRSDDELAVFVGDECRVVAHGNDYVLDSTRGASLEILVPISKSTEEVELRYYNATANAIYRQKVSISDIDQSRTIYFSAD